MTVMQHVRGQINIFGEPAEPNPVEVNLYVEIEIDLPAEVCWTEGEEPVSWDVDDLAASVRRNTPRLIDFLLAWNLLEGTRGHITLRDNRTRVSAYLDLE